MRGHHRAGDLRASTPLHTLYTPQYMLFYGRNSSSSSTGKGRRRQVDGAQAQVLSQRRMVEQSTVGSAECTAQGTLLSESSLFSFSSDEGQSAAVEMKVPHHHHRHHPRQRTPPVRPTTAIWAVVVAAVDDVQLISSLAPDAASKQQRINSGAAYSATRQMASQRVIGHILFEMCPYNATLLHRW